MRASEKTCGRSRILVDSPGGQLEKKVKGNPCGGTGAQECKCQLLTNSKTRNAWRASKQAYGC